ncbi:hypothetical protein [Luteimicrobium album]|uniref:hypothetical protein n=1 Tax=Luteimicrobium album TaxID=1054550 RepID=UPI0032AF5A17
MGVRRRALPARRRHDRPAAGRRRPRRRRAVRRDQGVPRGFWVIKAEDLDAALAWAKKGAVACGGPVEVRPFQDEPEA